MRRSVLAALLGSAVIAATSAASPATPAVGSPKVALTPLVATAFASPHPVRGADHRIHLVYELLVINSSSSVAKLEEVDILNASHGDALIQAEHGSQIIATLKGKDLDAHIKPLAPSPTLTLDPAHVTRLFFDATFTDRAAVPRRLEHRFTFTLTPHSGPASTDRVVSGLTVVTNTPPVVIGPPLSGSRWVAGGGCCFPPSPHRMATLPINGAFHVPERFAIDFVRLDAGNRLFSGPQSSNPSYPGFGANVLSVADGVVVGLEDGLPEQTPPNSPADATVQTAGGNYLVIDIGHGRFAFYAHLQPGSLRVHLHEHVKKGQVVGLLGNTGNSDGPHLHFHIMDGPGPLTSDGLPFEIRGFTVEGTITSSINDLIAGHPATVGPAARGNHHNELPLENEVVDFPG